MTRPSKNAGISQARRRDGARSLSSDQEKASMESSGGPRPHGDGQAVWGAKKHKPKLAALGVHLHRLLSSKRHHRGLVAAPEHSVLSSLSCRSMDPAATVVHPLPRDHGSHRRKSSGPRAGASLSSLSCRSMDPAAAVHQYQYRSREVQFSCKSTPPHKRLRALRHSLGLHQHGHRATGQERDHQPLELEYYGSTAAVTRLFELMDVEETAAKATDVDFDDGNLPDLEAAAAWPALSVGPAPRQVRITDSPFPVREEDDEVDRRAEEFITWFHEQLRTQQ